MDGLLSFWMTSMTNHAFFLRINQLSNVLYRLEEVRLLLVIDCFSNWTSFSAAVLVKTGPYQSKIAVIVEIVDHRRVSFLLLVEYTEIKMNL